VEQAQNSPEQNQWASIARDVEAIGGILGLEDAELAALGEHFLPVAPRSPEDTEPSPALALEPACWKMRELYDEWRAKPPAPKGQESPAVFHSRGEREAFERSTMGRLLGRKQPAYQPPLPLRTLLEGRRDFEANQTADAVGNTLSQLLAFQISKQKALLRSIMVETDLLQLGKSSPTAKPYPFLTGPTLLGDDRLPALDAYMAVVRGHPLLSADEERSLARRIRAGMLVPPSQIETQGAQKSFTPDALEARQILIVHNLRLVAKLAIFALAPRPQFAKGAPDIVQVGNLALIKGIDRFDPGRGPRLANYVALSIKGDIRRWIGREGLFMAGDSRHQQDRRKLVLDAHEGTIKAGNEATVEDAAKWQGYSLISIEELLHDPADKQAERLLDDVEHTLVVNALWADIKNTLSEREFDVLWSRFKLGHTAEELAAEAGVSHQMINIVERRALQKMRQHFGQPEPRPRAEAPTAFLEALGVRQQPGKDVVAQAAAVLAEMSLPERTRRILALRYGLDPQYPQPMTWKKIAEILGINPSMIRYYEQRGLRGIKTRDT
jgi:RNA polymerase sporulation-specific sigma factor